MQADIVVASMVVPCIDDTIYSDSGTLLEGGGGSLASLANDFASFDWMATWETVFMDNSGA